MKTAFLMLAALTAATPARAEQPYCSRGSQFGVLLRYKEYPAKEAMQHMHELCRGGDLISVPRETVDMFCDMSRQITPGEYSMSFCTYLGAPRQIR
jgi:hypothetical protein